jgi:hypothetical protein
MPLTKTTQNNCSFSGKNVLDGLLEAYQASFSGPAARQVAPASGVS